MEVVYTQIGPWSLLAVIGFAWVKGWIGSLRDRERLIDLYREAFEHERKARERSERQVEELMEIGRASNHVLAELPAAVAVAASVPARPGEPDATTVG
jgi:hypothetical protein